MCIISGEIDEVSATRIIAANLGGNRQLIVYSNTVKLSGPPVAMILPYPAATSADSLEVLMTTPADNECYNILDDCVPLDGVSGDGDGDADSDVEPLPVLRAGSYRYSVAENVVDLCRIDRTIFAALPQDLTTLLSDYSARGFGFIVCIIDATAAYSPFAYICSTLRSGNASELFIPTKHYHVGTGAAATATADWDHDVYVVGIQCQPMPHPIYHGLRCNTVRALGNAGSRQIDAAKLAATSFAPYLVAANDSDMIAKFQLTGNWHPNEDMILSIPAALFSS